MQHNPPAPRKLRFGPFEVDSRAMQISRGGKVLRVQQKPVELLVLLLERAGDVVTREEARERLWPDGVHVDYEQGLANAVQKLRRALGDSAANPRFIETLPKRGYRFVGEIETARAAGLDGPSVPPARSGDGRRSWSVAVAAACALVLVSLLPAASKRLEEMAAGRPEEGRARLSEAGRQDDPALSPEAWEALLRGRHFWKRRTPDAVRQSIVWFRRALDLDPRLAPASAGLAEAYHSLGALGVISHEEAYRRAREAARDALAIDPDLGAAYAVLAETTFRFGPRRAPVEAWYRRALALEPDSATARQAFANFLALTGRMTEAMSEMERAHAEDPLSLQINLDLAAILYDSGRRDEAEDRIRRTMDLDPSYPKAHFVLASLHQHEHRLGDAVAELERTVELAPDVPKFVHALGVAYVDAGSRAKAVETLDRLRAMSGTRPVERGIVEDLEERISRAWPSRAVARAEGEHPEPA